MYLGETEHFTSIFIIYNMEYIQNHVEINGSKLMRKEYCYLNYPFIIFYLYFKKKKQF